MTNRKKVAVGREVGEKGRTGSAGRSGRNQNVEILKAVMKGLDFIPLETGNTFRGY